MADQRYIYPQATYRPVPGVERRPKQTPTTVAAHTAVDSPRAHTLWWHVSVRGNAKYHFFVRKEPDAHGRMVEQYLPTNVKGAAMRYLDGKSIVVETDDDGDPEGIQWNAKQIAALVDLFGWCADTHGIERRLVTPNTAYSLSNYRRWVVGVEGFCFHSQPAREPSGTHSMIRGRFNPWTAQRSQGKTCPGDTRVKQFYEQVLPPLLAGEAAVVVPLKYGVDTLGSGDEGDAVETLQRNLNLRHGAAIDVDGDFGPATLAAVLRAQTQLGVTADGLWGPESATASWKFEQVTLQRRADLKWEISKLEQKLAELKAELATLS